jgi:hypothetical protein
MLKNYLKNQTLFKTKTLGFNNVKNNANNHLTSIFILLFCLFGMTDALAGGVLPQELLQVPILQILLVQVLEPIGMQFHLLRLAMKCKFLLMLDLQLL